MTDSKPHMRVQILSGRNAWNWGIVLLYVSVVKCQLHLISISSGIRGMTGYRTMVPLFEVATRQLVTAYPRTIGQVSHTFKYSESAVACTPSEADTVLASLMQLYQKKSMERDGLTAIVVSTVCVEMFAPVGDFARELDVFAFSCALNDKLMTDPVRFPSVVSAGPINLPLYGKTFIKLLQHFQWKSVAILSDFMTSDFPNQIRYNQTCKYFREALSTTNILMRWIEFDSDSNTTGWNFALKTASQFTRIIVSCTTSIRQRGFLRKADEMGLSNGDYVFIMPYSFVVPDDLPFSCENRTTALYQYEQVTDGNLHCDDKILRSLRSALVIQPTFPKWETFAAMMQEVLAERQKLYNISNHDMESNQFAANCYETIQSIAETYNNHFAELEHVGKVSGRKFRGYFTNSSFSFPSQNVRYSDGLRATSIQILQFSVLNASFATILEINSLRPDSLAGASRAAVWLRGTAPTDRPKCGPWNECADQTPVYVAVGATAGALLTMAGLALVIVHIIRHQGRTANDAFTWWIIPLSDMAFPGTEVSAFPAARTKAPFSAGAKGSGLETNWLTQTPRAIQTPRAVYKAAAFSDRFVELRGAPCWASWIDKEALDIGCIPSKAGWDMTTTAKMVKLMNAMRALRHDNINPFKGIHLGSPGCIVEEYCERGSVAEVFAQDCRLDMDMKISTIIDLIRGFITNPEVNERKTLKKINAVTSSLEIVLNAGQPLIRLKVNKPKNMYDLAYETQGLHFIHASALHYHGSLRSTKCLLNRLFSLRIADCGNARIKSIIDSGEPEQPYKLLWTPPENLRGTKQRSSATDVYSMAIIMHEIFNQNGPFALGAVENISQQAAHGILHRVHYMDAVPYRPPVPQMPTINPTETCLLELMRQCWSEAPEWRPTISHVRTTVLEILHDQNIDSASSLIGRIIKRLASYHSHLEVLVIERTEEYLAEKNKCDSVLMEMFPKPILHQLRTGGEVSPEICESVTVGFCSVIGYENLLGRNTVGSFIEFLDRVYSEFDSALQFFDAYKMETVGTSYMLVSGIANRNGAKHCEEVCRAAIRFRTLFQKLCTYGQINIRAGLHSGPVAAGIVGHKNPRYCLFGDTVNYASRMDSNSLPGFIQLSTNSALLIKSTGLTVTCRGVITVKGKGELTTYFLE